MNLLRPFRKPGPATGLDGLPTVAVVGAMRSGTNLVSHLLETHWKVKVTYNALGWKHAPMPVLAAGSGLAYPDIPILHVSKNPYAFVLGLFRYLRLSVEKNQKISLAGATTFEDFLQSPITIHDSQLKHSPQLRFASPVDYWNSFYWGYEHLEASAFRTLRLTHEALVADPQKLVAVEKLLKLERAVWPVRLPEQKLDRSSTSGRRKSEEQQQQPFDASYILEQKFVEELTDTQIQFISRNVDPELMRLRGYDLL